MGTTKGEKARKNFMVLIFCPRSNKRVWHNLMVKPASETFRCTCCGTERQR